MNQIKDIVVNTGSGTGSNAKIMADKIMEWIKL